MKRNLVAAILGIAVSVGIGASAHAQGSVIFANYAYNTDAPIVYGPGYGPLAGKGVNNAFTAGLWYFLGTATLSQDDYGWSTLPSGWEVASISQQINTGAAGPGYFIGPIAQISDYVSGPITFAVTAYTGGAYDYASLRAHSAGFTLPSIAVPGEFGPGLKSFAISAPEPSLFALSGLAALAMMFRRRRKQERG